MNNTQKRTHYLDLAHQWQDRVDEEMGKTLENGWTSWEVYQAERRADYCRLKRDACLNKAASYE